MERTGGGDIPEAYELVLRQAQTKLSWTPGSHRSLVMIGDASPHESGYYGQPYRIDWKKEADKLANMVLQAYFK